MRLLNMMSKNQIKKWDSKNLKTEEKIFGFFIK